MDSKEGDSASLREPLHREVMTFTRTQDTLTVFDDVKKRYPEARLIPVPSQISRSCGLAIQFPEGELAEHQAYFNALSVEASLYQMELQTDQRGVNWIIAVRQIS